MGYAYFLRSFFASLGFIPVESNTDNEITLSSFPNSIPFMPFDDLPLNILNLFDINLMHLPN